MKDKATFIICTEQGVLEYKSILFVKSLRQFGGKFKNAEVLSYSPRKDFQPSSNTKNILKSLGVHLISENLNTEFAHYGFGNKPLVCGHAEKNTNSDLIYFFDSDQIILEEPSFLELAECDIALRPVEQKGVGAESSTDPNFKFWKEAYKTLDIVPPATKVLTGLDLKNIYPYWNVGLVPVKASKGLFQEWESVFIHLMRKKIVPDMGITFMDQTSCALTVLKKDPLLKELPLSYNYPINAQDKIPEVNKVNDFGEIVSAHYHKLFDQHVRVNPLNELFSSSEKTTWVEEELKVMGVLPKNTISYFFRKGRCKIKAALK
ncbi:hypothetical protein [Sediminitomix flava]|uniref:Uncharacterized protein n=1 Tax=Sediminitomix flava TaxID=379075 RepID=A0A315ZCN2_SEDFL|nr:hypothetical protein [Sediminitomix flava]PWJ43301.1 hypothetical protein BC781_102850 [Sediminitomix flava]